MARRSIYVEEAYFLGINDGRQPQEGKKQVRYQLTDEQYEQVLLYRNKGIENSCNNLDVDISTVKHLWKKTKEESVFVKNPLFKEETEIKFDDFQKRFEKNITKFLNKNVTPTKPKVADLKPSYLFDLCVITDVHVGMNTNPNGFGLYGGKWDDKELEERRKIIVQETIETQKHDKLLIFDLGDFMDGWDGETVRKGHHLPQNMDNEKAFDVGLMFKIKLIDDLLQYYSEIEMVNICDDNHSGSFAYVVNSAFKLFVEHKYNQVKIINQRKFIDHYIYGKKVFVLTHGKDGKNLKFGFKPFLDPKQIEKINNYLDQYSLYEKDYEIIFMKGDSHQDIFDNTTSQRFKYWNFPALSPASNWVQTNFKRSISGFYNFNFKEKSISLHPYYFEWKE
jgi:hypothetical protein